MFFFLVRVAFGVAERLELRECVMRYDSREHNAVTTFSTEGKPKVRISFFFRDIKVGGAEHAPERGKKKNLKAKNFPGLICPGNPLDVSGLCVCACVRVLVRTNSHGTTDELCADGVRQYGKLHLLRSLQYRVRGERGGS
jgi:hypothetical protein